ncbi:hypothetical protein ACFP51_11160 [Streptomyces pratens]|uniref:Uncharacterized protein n=1 Tax=Streptomyces pratens TaxID=887456 RepID=A0ABW1M3V9_9ACTN
MPHAAVTAPERFACLALLIPPTAWETRPAQAAAYRRLADFAESGGPQAVTTALAAPPVPTSVADAPGYPPTLCPVSQGPAHH